MLAYLRKVLGVTTLAITPVVLLHEAFSSKSFATLVANKAVSMVRLVLIVEFSFFWIDLTPTGCTTNLNIRKYSIVIKLIQKRINPNYKPTPVASVLLFLNRF